MGNPCCSRRMRRIPNEAPEVQQGELVGEEEIGQAVDTEWLVVADRIRVLDWDRVVRDFLRLGRRRRRWWQRCCQRFPTRHVPCRFRGPGGPRASRGSQNQGAFLAFGPRAGTPLETPEVGRLGAQGGKLYYLISYLPSYHSFHPDPGEPLKPRLDSHRSPGQNAPWAKCIIPFYPSPSP